MKKPVSMLRTWRLVLSIERKRRLELCFRARPFCLYRFSWNKRIAGPYFIKSAEDDIIVNPTFSYKMDAEHGVNS